MRGEDVEIAPGVHRIVTPLGERINCLYLFAGAEAALLFDTGIDPTVRRALPSALEEIGYPADRVRHAVNSHCDWDHTGGNGAVTELLPRVTLMCHELDRPNVEDLDRLFSRRYGEFAADHGIDEPEETRRFVEDNIRLVPVDVGLRGGEVVHLGGGWHVEILHTPGHSRGHLSVWDPRSRAVAIGDAVLGHAVPLADGSPAFPPTYRYVDSYLSSIGRLEGLRPRWVLTSHYPIYRDEQAAEFLADSRAYVDRVDRALAGALGEAEEPLTMAQLIGRLAQGLGEWPDQFDDYLVHPFGGHLERFEQWGRVEGVEGPGGRKAFVWSEA